MKNRKLKVCLAASAGGHITQLLKLAECWQNYETFSVTTTDVMVDKLKVYGNVYVVGESNRQHMWLVFKVFLKCIKIVFTERPDVVISTGAAAGCMVCFLSKMLGAKVIWMDSITNVERLSLSGRMVRHIADVFLTQWPELAAKYKNVEFVGSVI
jgi:UDP-N-acetylglucosamine:LPS N-acetylglucosamine transferase